MIASYAVHVLAGAAWLGGLPALLLAVLEQQFQPEAEGRRLAILMRFSKMAMVAVSAIVLSGIANTAFRIGMDLGALVGVPYGTILLVKLGFVAVMLALAANTRFRTMPRLERTLRDHAGDAPPAFARRLTRSLALELAAGVLVLAAVSVLGITAPPR